MEQTYYKYTYHVCGWRIMDPFGKVLYPGKVKERLQEILQKEGVLGLYSHGRILKQRILKECEEAHRW